MTDQTVTPEKKRRILAVLAHPDDETFGMGGTLAMYAHQGVQVFLLCATRGEVGEVDEKFMRGFASIGERRESELRCAAKLLGITEVHFLGYRDSGMPGSPDNQHPQALVAQPLDQVAADVVHFIRLIRPQIVLTFDPIGGYRHPDHIAIQRATEKAFSSSATAMVGADGLAPHAAQKLYFHTMPKGFVRLGVALMRLFGKDPRKFGRNGDIDLVSIAEVSFPTHARIGYRAVAKIKDEAAACHASQGGPQMSSGWMGALRRLTASTDTFMQAFPPPASKKQVRDLFDGVV
jgi:N-acetyl-1-D-myo-inositol-2-amino-2-deoxy-alpha-D-glucopyranoside deacetylase